MPIATVVKSWRDSTNAFLAVRVSEGGAIGDVEYIGSVPLADLVGFTPAQQKAALVVAVKAVRDAQIATIVDLPISGTVTV